MKLTRYVKRVLFDIEHIWEFKFTYRDRMPCTGGGIACSFSQIGKRFVYAAYSIAGAEAMFARLSDFVFIVRGTGRQDCSGMPPTPWTNRVVAERRVRVRDRR